MIYRKCFVALSCCFCFYSFALNSNELIDRLNDLEETIKEIHGKLESAESCIKKNTARIEYLEQQMHRYEEEKIKLEEKSKFEIEKKNVQSSKEIIDSIINIRQTREFEKYKYYLLKNRRLSNIFDCLVEDYSFVFAVVSKYYITKVYNKFSFKNCIKRIERIIEKEKEIVDEMFKIR